ncbi:hypothetical protein GCM10028807_37100 [Spirosoma daeguense]
MAFYQRVLPIVILLLVDTFCLAQVGVKKVSRQSNHRTEDTTPILNQLTGQRISINDYAQLTKNDPYAYHLVPQYNEFGQAQGYVMRASTPEERQTHRFRDRDPAKQPKAGQSIMPFVMTGLDGNVYCSSELAGKIVILNFLISLEKEFWDDNQNADLTATLRSYSSSTAPVVLGVLNSEQAKNDKNLNLQSLPFVPVPNAYGFHNKFHITSVPTIIVIDKSGKVVANLQGNDINSRLKQVLTALY